MDPNTLIYLDNNASTAPDPTVVKAVVAAMVNLYANPSSQHGAGLEASIAIETARKALATLLGSGPQDIVYTSGATEANNLVLQGAWAASESASMRRTRIVVGATEHPSVLEVAKVLSQRGADVVVARVHRTGLIDLDYLADVVDDRTLLVSVMLANNETGVIAPLDAIVEIAKRHGTLVHTDASQAVGRIPVSYPGLNVDFLSMSGHKICGPKGVGALLCNRRVAISSTIHGGGQERGLRSGTLNTAGIVGLGVAAQLALGRIDGSPRVAALRDRFVAGVKGAVSGVTENGAGAPRLPNTANLRFLGADSEAVMAGMPGLACSSGSACSSAVPSPSHVLLAMGLGPEAAAESLRFSLSHLTTSQDVDAAVGLVAESVRHVRSALGVVVS